jgi:hypothetical protein
MQVPVQVFLSVEGSHLPAAEVTVLLGLQPHVERPLRSLKAKNQTEQPEGITRTEYWAHIFSSSEVIDSTELAKQVLKLLDGKQTELARIKAAGGLTVLSVPVNSEQEDIRARETLTPYDSPRAIEIRVELWRHPHAVLG